MIISASRRTDIPCFFADWFMHRARAGYVYTRNPMNRSQVHQVALDVEHVDFIMFWTKDAQPMLDKLPELDQTGYLYGFQFTLTPYGKEIEGGLRNKSDIEDTFIQLGQTIGKERLFWRYDPIILNNELTIAYHDKAFTRLCERLHPYTEAVDISFVDTYAKLKNRPIREISQAEMQEIGGRFAETAQKHGLIIKTCCETVDLSPFGIQPGACIDKHAIERICGYPIAAKPDKYQREGCHCLASVDIGMYNTCLNGCVYCYANHGGDSIQKNRQNHRPDGDFLIGERLESDKVYEKK